VTGHTDMRKGFDGLALIVQETLRRDPYSGHLFVFRGRRGSLIKCLWSDVQGLCLFSKRNGDRRAEAVMGFRLDMSHAKELIRPLTTIARPMR
jgi:hypothetical protein